MKIKHDMFVALLPQNMVTLDDMASIFMYKLL